MSRNAVIGREVFQRFSQESLNTPQRPSFLDMHSSPSSQRAVEASTKYKRYRQLELLKQ